MILLIIIASIFFIYAFILIVKAVILLLKALFYTVFANEKQIDEGFKKHVVKVSDEYKEFETKFDKGIDDLINPRTFEL